jgi:hypothetical protein
LAKESVLHNYLHIRNGILQGLMLCAKKRNFDVSLRPSVASPPSAFCYLFPQHFTAEKPASTSQIAYMFTQQSSHWWLHFSDDSWTISNGLKLGFSDPTKRLGILGAFYNPGHH